MQLRQIGACMQRKFAFIGIQRGHCRANDVIEEGWPMSFNGTKRTSQAGLVMSVVRGRLEVAGPRLKLRF